MPMINFVDAGTDADAMLEALVLADGRPVIHLGPPVGWPDLAHLPPGVRVVPHTALGQASVHWPEGFDPRRPFTARCFSAGAAGLLAGKAERVIVRLPECPPRATLDELARIGVQDIVLPESPAHSGQCKVIPFPAGKADRSRREELRKKLGLTEEHIVVAAPSRVHRVSGHRQAVWFSGVLIFAGRPVRLLLRDYGHQSYLLSELARDSHIPELVITAPEDLGDLDLLATADVAIFMGQTLPPVAALSAMAAGLPIVAADTPLARRLLGEAALYVPYGKPRPVAQALLRLQEEPALPPALAAAGKAILPAHDLAAVQAQWHKLLP